VVDMTKSPNRINVIDFIISVLVRYERQLSENLDRLERIVSDLSKMKSSERNSEHLARPA